MRVLDLENGRAQQGASHSPQAPFEMLITGARFKATQEAPFLFYLWIWVSCLLFGFENLTPRPQEFTKKKSYYYLNRWFNLSGTQSLSFTMMRCFLITPFWSFLKILFFFNSSKIWLWDLILRVRRQVEFERWAENLAVGFYVTVRCLEKTNYCVLWAPLIYSYFHPQNYSHLVNAPHSRTNFNSSKKGLFALLNPKRLSSTEIIIYFLHKRYRHLAIFYTVNQLFIIMIM